MSDVTEALLNPTVNLFNRGCKDVVGAHMDDDDARCRLVLKKAADGWNK